VTATTASASDRGVIHDLGYRHYTGARLGRLHIVRALYVDTLRGAFGIGRSAASKVIPWGLFAMMAFPAALIVIVAAIAESAELPGGYTSYVLNLQMVVAVFLASQAPVAVSRDLRFRVLPLYLSRPLSRDDYVLAKYAAFSTAVFVLLATPLVILFAGALLVRMPLVNQITGVLAALGGAVLASLVLSGIALTLAAITPRRGFGVASIITVLLLCSTVSLSAQAIAVEAKAMTMAGYLGLLSPFSLVQGVQTWVFGTESHLPSGPPGTAGGLVFVAVTAAVLTGSYCLLLLRYRKVSVS
jgi:ABC-2 type transport system permease protein